MNRAKRLEEIKSEKTLEVRALLSKDSKFDGATVHMDFTDKITGEKHTITLTMDRNPKR